MTDTDTVRAALDHLYHAGEAPTEWLTTGLAALDRLVAERDEAHKRGWGEGRALSKAREVTLVAERDRLREALDEACQCAFSAMNQRAQADYGKTWQAYRDYLLAREALGGDQ